MKIWQGGEALLDPFRRNRPARSELGGASMLLCNDAGDNGGRVAVVWLASKFEAGTVKVIKVDAGQSREL